MRQPVASDGDASGHLQCPFCHCYDVSRLYLASIRIDACECAACGARWDEQTGSGEYRGRADKASLFISRRRD